MYSKKIEKSPKLEKLIDENGWIPGVDYPEWMIDRSLVTLKGGYLIDDESPKDAIMRIANRVNELIPSTVYDGNLKEAVFQSIWSGDVCPSSPVWSNFGSKRGLPISCFGSYIGDSISSIYYGLAENAKMSQLGGGTSSYWGDVRPRGSKITGQSGSTGGSFEFLSNFESMITKVSQGGTRRGSHAAYTRFDNPDVEEILNIKRPGCDIQDLFTGISIGRDDIDLIYSGDKRANKVWSKILESRNQTGIPYLLFRDNANDGISTPPWYGKPDTQIKASNLCSEIMLPSNDDESFVCCLLSMNAVNFDKWRYNDSVQVANIIMEAILEDFIIKTSGIEEMRRSRRFAQRHRAVGLGVLGLHSYLQDKNQPFTGVFATAINHKILQVMKTNSISSTENLAKKLGNCPVVEEYNQKYGTSFLRRHATLLAIAPTTSNATIAGGVSSGIEPIASNYFVQKSAKGNFTVVNKRLQELFETKYPMYNTAETWNTIRNNRGSVQHLDWMDKDDKDVYKTFSEINQFEIVRLAGIRQRYLDQGQSLNVHVDPYTKPKLVSDLYLFGSELGVKAFYYQRSSNILRDKGKSDILAMDAADCVSCDG